MGLATIDPHSHKMQTKLYKITKCGVNRPKSKQDTAIRKCQNLQRNVWSWPCIRRLSPRYDRQSKFWSPNDTITAFFFAANKNKNSAQVPLASTSS